MFEIYNQMFEESSRSILRGGISLDPHLLNLELDKRLGISLLIPVQNDFLPQINQIKLLEPDQYFYPSTDWHITLQVIVTGNNQFNPENHPIRKYISILDSVLNDIHSFKIDFHGLTLSDGAVLAQGFSEEIQKIRKKIRTAFDSEGLVIHERYFPQTAHVTLMRFRKPLQNPRTFINILKEARNIPFGYYQVNSVKLNICDWYNQKEKRYELSSFMLKPKSTININDFKGI